MYKLGEIVVEKSVIKEKVRLLADRINQDYAGKDLIVIGVLKGALVFMADLIRELEMKVTMDFIVVSSYGIDTKTSGVVLLVKDIDTNIEGKHVLVVEDLIDTGLTLRYLKELFELRQPASLEICTFFNKPARRVVGLNVKYSGMIIEDKFIVGYGLDYANQYRNLPDVRAMERD